MAFLVANIPPVDVWVKKEYLYDLEKGHGELTPGVWVSVKSVMGKALYFETLLTDYGACFDKLPISAFVWKQDYDKDNQLPLDHLQIWDCFDYDITVIRKPMLSDCEFFGKDKRMHKGEYIFTIDNCHRDQNVLNVNLSEHDPEHKSFNVIKMDNGQFAAQPNNRIIFTDQSLVHPDRKMPDFKVCSQNYTVEDTPKWSVGHTDEWSYKSKDEEITNPVDNTKDGFDPAEVEGYEDFNKKYD